MIDVDDELRALHWATTHLPPPEPVVKARQAQADLWARVKAEPFRVLSRDEDRLDRRYQSIHDRYVASAVEAYGSR